eukprot:1159016-Pelagomonas_calceolata.AAC.14
MHRERSYQLVNALGQRTLFGYYRVDLERQGNEQMKQDLTMISSDKKLLRFRVRQRIKSVLERCDDYQASFTPKPGPSPQESSGNQSIQAAAPAVESGKPCAVISSDKQTGGIQEEPLSLQPPKQAQAAASSTQSLRLWQQQQLMKMRDMQKKEVMGLQERSCSQGGQGQATQDQQPAHSFEPIRLAFRDTTNRFNGELHHLQDEIMR